MNVTTPARSASEQLLISQAADRAAQRLADALALKEGPVFVDASLAEGYDSKYAIGAVRAALARHGATLAPTREAARTVVEIRFGALSLDTEKSLLGLPELNLPIPLATGVRTPEIALFKKDSTQGVAKMAALAYDRDDGTLVAAPTPQYGFADKTEWTMALFISWESGDFLPADARPGSVPVPDAVPLPWPTTSPDEDAPPATP
ncbi:DUF6655 family protein [Pararhodospirillum oryzae]|nr:DUF6655 family protein [Pararhodospirillum oryzae]